MPVIYRLFFVRLMFTFAGFSLFSPLATAQTVYKCADAKGGAVYQSHPCDDGRPANKRWVTEPRTTTWDDYYARQAAERKIERDRRALRARNAAGSAARPAPSGTVVSQHANAGRCEAAKRSRAQTLEAIGLRRTYAQIAQLDNMVQEACK